MRIVSAAEMREIDRATSERFGVPSLTLMENAGAAVARFVLSDYPRAERVGILCGKGNNGGDGFVVARKLVEAGKSVRVLIMCAPEDLHGDAGAMFKSMLQSMIVQLQPEQIAPLFVRGPSELDSSDVAETFAADVIVDAILGTGFRPPVSPLYAAAIAKMNAAAAPIVAVDIPSGADADAMQPETAADSSDRARADAVVTFTAPRPAHVFAGLTTGPTVIAPIGSPPEAIVSEFGLHLSTPPDFAALLAARAGRQQGQLRTRAGDRRIARQSRCGGDGGIRGAPSGRWSFDSSHAEIRARNRCGLSSRTNDRVAAGNRTRHNLMASARSGLRCAAGT